MALFTLFIGLFLRICHCLKILPYKIHQRKHLASKCVTRLRTEGDPKVDDQTLQVGDMDYFQQTMLYIISYHILYSLRDI